MICPVCPWLSPHRSPTCVWEATWSVQLSKASEFEPSPRVRLWCSLLSCHFYSQHFFPGLNKINQNESRDCFSAHVLICIISNFSAWGPSSHPFSTVVAGGGALGCGLECLKGLKAVLNIFRPNTSPLQDLQQIKQNTATLSHKRMLSLPSTAIRAMLSKSQPSWIQNLPRGLAAGRNYMHWLCVLLLTSHCLEETDDFFEPGEEVHHLFPELRSLFQ